MNICNLLGFQIKVDSKCLLKCLSSISGDQLHFIFYQTEDHTRISALKGHSRVKHKQLFGNS